MNLVSVSVIILSMAQAFHLYEEVHTGFRRAFPLGEIPEPLFVSANLVAFVFALVTVCLCQAETTVGFTLAWVYGIIMLLNGCLHIGIMALRRKYFPGGATALPVVVAAVNLIYQLIRR
jgi:hypothetical protein